MAHACVARGCQKRVGDHLLMCAYHWHMVPRDLQSRIYAAYRRRDPGLGRLQIEAYRAVHRHEFGEDGEGQGDG